MTKGSMDSADKSAANLITLEPLVHQVSGHSSMWVLDDVTVCKPLIGREAKFYRSLPPKMAPFVPEYRGTLKLMVQRTPEGLSVSALSPEDKLPRHASSRVRRHSGPRRTSAAHNPWLEQCHQRYLQKLRSKDGATVMDCILLENLTHVYRVPNVLDLKMGTRQYGDDAPETKRRSQTRKALQTTTPRLGVRLAGMQVYNRDTACYVCKNKYVGRELTEEGFQQTLKHFLLNGRRFRADIVDQIIAKLTELHRTVAQLESFRFFTSSLLILYDSYDPKTGSKISKDQSVKSDTSDSKSTKDSDYDTQKTKVSSGMVDSVPNFNATNKLISNLSSSNELPTEEASSVFASKRPKTSVCRSDQVAIKEEGTNLEELRLNNDLQYDSNSEPGSLAAANSNSDDLKGFCLPTNGVGHGNHLRSSFSVVDSTNEGKGLVGSGSIAPQNTEDLLCKEISSGSEVSTMTTDQSSVALTRNSVPESSVHILSDSEFRAIQSDVEKSGDISEDLLRSPDLVSSAETPHSSDVSNVVNSLSIRASELRDALETSTTIETKNEHFSDALISDSISKITLQNSCARAIDGEDVESVRGSEQQGTAAASRKCRGCGGGCEQHDQPCPAPRQRRAGVTATPCPRGLHDATMSPAEPASTARHEDLHGANGGCDESVTYSSPKTITARFMSTTFNIAVPEYVPIDPSSDDASGKLRDDEANSTHGLIHESGLSTLKTIPSNGREDTLSTDLGCNGQNLSGAACSGSRHSLSPKPCDTSLPSVRSEAPDAKGTNKSPYSSDSTDRPDVPHKRRPSPKKAPPRRPSFSTSHRPKSSTEHKLARSRKSSESGKSGAKSKPPHVPDDKKTSKAADDASYLCHCESSSATEEGSAGRTKVDIRLIDFAHATHRGLGDATVYTGPDEGLMLGLTSLIRIFQDIKNIYAK